MFLGTGCLSQQSRFPSHPALCRGTLNPFLRSERLDLGSGLISSPLSTLLFSGETPEAIQSPSLLSVQGTQGQTSLLELSPEPGSQVNTQEPFCGVTPALREKAAVKS